MQSWCLSTYMFRRERLCDMGTLSRSVPKSTPLHFGPTIIERPRTKPRETSLPHRSGPLDHFGPGTSATSATRRFSPTSSGTRAASSSASPAATRRRRRGDGDRVGRGAKHRAGTGRTCATCGKRGFSVWPCFFRTSKGCSIFPGSASWRERQLNGTSEEYRPWP